VRPLHYHFKLPHLRSEAARADFPHDPRFGAVETYHAPDIADEVGVGWTRIIFYWSELERESPDDWNVFHQPLDRIDREIAGGREVVGMLQDTPAWATDGLPAVGVPRGLYLPVDDPDNVWAGFVRDVVREYKGRVNRWIIWNEPDISLDVYGTQFAGSTEDYYQLVKVAYQAAHEVNPDVKIHLAALTYWHDSAYFERFMDLAKADPDGPSYGYFFDVASTHIYFKPETTAQILDSMKGHMDRTGIVRPIWINETNAPPYDDPTHPWDKPLLPVTQHMQASFLLQEYALALAHGADHIAVYKWIDQPPPPPGYDVYGLLRPDGDPRPAFDAYKLILEHYAGTTTAEQVETGKTQLVILDRGDQTTRVIWSRLEDKVLAVIPALASQGLLIDRGGAQRPINPVFGQYILILDAATCPPDFGCFIGGSPAIIVEESPAIATGTQFEMTFTTLFRTGGTVLFVLAVTGVGWLIYRRRRYSANPS
jgi:hypothetical protein